MRTRLLFVLTFVKDELQTRALTHGQVSVSEEVVPAKGFSAHLPFSCLLSPGA